MPEAFVNERFTFTQPDGTEFEVVGTGNQFEAVFETPAGYTVAKNPVTGFYHYASLSADATRLEPSGEVVTSTPVETGERRHLRTTRAATQLRAEAARAEGERPRWEIRRRQQMARLAAAGAFLADAPAPAVPSGDVRGLCLLIRFPDVAESITRQQVDDFCNLTGYTGFGNNGSVRDYFVAASENRLRYTQRGDRLPHRRPQPQSLHRPHDPLRPAGAGADPRGAGGPGGRRLRLLPTHRRRCRQRLCPQRLLRRHPCEQLVRGALATRLDARHSIRHRRRASVGRLPDHRHRDQPHAADLLPRERPHGVRLPRPLRLRRGVRRSRPLLPDVLRRQQPQPGGDQRRPQARGRVDHLAAARGARDDVPARRRGQRLPASTSAAPRSTSSARTATSPGGTRRSPTRAWRSGTSRRAATTATSR